MQQIEFSQFIERALAEQRFVERRVSVRQQMAQTLNDLLAHIEVVGQPKLADSHFDLLSLHGSKWRFVHSVDSCVASQLIAPVVARQAQSIVPPHLTTGHFVVAAGAAGAAFFASVAALAVLAALAEDELSPFALVVAAAAFSSFFWPSSCL